jgi:hypothetical protein
VVPQLNSRLVPLTLVLLAAVTVTAGCGLRAQIRESDRKAAIHNVQTWHDHRKWDRCVASAERAQASSKLDPVVGAETTYLKAACLSELGRKAEAYGHYRLLKDYLEPEGHPIALPKKVEDRLSRERSLAEVRAAPHNQSLMTIELPGARLTQSAKWSGIAGGVTVQWEINRQGESREIRVLDDVHPLLAGLAIEAAASTTIDEGKVNRGLLPLTKRVQFRFED